MPYPTEFRHAVVTYAKSHTVNKTAAEFKVSRTAITKWCTAAGVIPKPDRIGAPEGNTNTYGGRILTADRPTFYKLHSHG